MGAFGSNFGANFSDTYSSPTISSLVAAETQATEDELWTIKVFPSFDLDTITLNSEFETDIVTNRDGGEHRLALRDIPLRTIELQTMSSGGEDSMLISEYLERSTMSKQLFPLVSDIAQVTNVDIGLFITYTIDALDIRRFNRLYRCLIFKYTNNSLLIETFEIRDIGSVTSTDVVVLGNTNFSNADLPDLYIVPLIEANINIQTNPKLLVTDNKYRLNISATECVGVTQLPSRSTVPDGFQYFSRINPNYKNFLFDEDINLPYTSPAIKLNSTTLQAGIIFKTTGLLSLHSITITTKRTASDSGKKVYAKLAIATWSGSEFVPDISSPLGTSSNYIDMSSTDASDVIRTLEFEIPINLPVVDTSTSRYFIYLEPDSPLTPGVIEIRSNQTSPNSSGLYQATIITGPSAVVGNVNEDIWVMELFYTPSLPILDLENYYNYSNIQEYFSRVGSLDRSGLANLPRVYGDRPRKHLSSALVVSGKDKIHDLIDFWEYSKGQLNPFVLVSPFSLYNDIFKGYAVNWPDPTLESYNNYLLSAFSFEEDPFQPTVSIRDSVNSHHARMPVLGVTQTGEGKFNNGLTFRNRVIYSYSSPNITDIGEEFTTCCWIKWNSAVTENTIIFYLYTSSGGTNTYVNLKYIYASNTFEITRAVNTAPSVKIYEATNTADLTKWTHLGLIQNSNGSWDLAVDGTILTPIIQIASGIGTSPRLELKNSFSSISIQVDQWLIYNKSLGSPFFTAIYNTGSGVEKLGTSSGINITSKTHLIDWNYRDLLALVQTDGTILVLELDVANKIDYTDVNSQFIPFYKSLPSAPDPSELLRITQANVVRFSTDQFSEIWRSPSVMITNISTVEVLMERFTDLVFELP